MELCEVLDFKPAEGEILVRTLDARAGSPLIDIKPYLPYSDRADELQLPEWAQAPPPPKSGKATEETETRDA